MVDVVVGFEPLRPAEFVLICVRQTRDPGKVDPIRSGRGVLPSAKML
jgi:hypothetical protein